MRGQFEVSEGGILGGENGLGTHTRGTTRTKVQTVRKMMKARIPSTTGEARREEEWEGKVRRRESGKRDVAEVELTVVLVGSWYETR